MIIQKDISSESKAKDKYGFRVSISDAALDTILREQMDLPKGKMVRVSVDQERMIINFYYDGEAPGVDEEGDPEQPCCARIGEGGEYPSRGLIRL